MPNTDPLDNITNSRSLVAPATGVHWTGDDPYDASRYVRGTIQLEGATGAPTVGRIQSCSFSEMAGGNEELDDGAGGVEAYDYWKLGWKCSVTARFRTGDGMPRIGKIFVLNVPEGATGENAPLRFVVDGEPTVNWAVAGLRSITFNGKMHASMVRSPLVVARVRADGTTAAQVNSAFPSGGFGDAVPVEDPEEEPTP